MRTLGHGPYRLLLESTPAIARGTMLDITSQREVGIWVAARPESVVESAASYLRVVGMAVEAAQLERHFRAVEGMQ